MSTITLTQNDPLAQQTAKLHLRGDGEASAVKRNAHAPGPDYPYARFLPSYDQDYKLAPLEPFEHIDPGHAALKDANPREFLEGATEKHLSPKFGSEIEGIQLSKLDAKAKG